MMATKRKVINKSLYVLNELRSINKHWQDNWMLFAQSGTLLLVDRETGKVIESFYNINCDGGDADSYVGEDGNEYIQLP